MEDRTIPWDEFEKEFKPIQNHLDNNASLDGNMYETYGEEYEYVVEIYKKIPNTVWTYVAVDEELILVNGLATVNRMGYVITGIEFNPKENIEVLDT